ncbi:MAG: PIG-L family deacetylase [Terrimesophilobacter sp.]
MTLSSAREHVLFVHAHPDDESITTGGAIATLLDAGVAVTLLTCTRGELGEVIPEELQHLSGDALGAHRESELAAAVAVLGLKDHRFLGADGACAAGVSPHRFRDSGMQWGPNGPEPLNVAESPPSIDSLARADIGAVLADICAVIADIRPIAVISYDSGGGYGHPDHVRTHEAASFAAHTMSVPFYAIIPVGQQTEGDILLDVSRVLDRKTRALEAYRTQLTVEGNSIVHSGGQVELINDTEIFRPPMRSHTSELEWSHLRIFTKAATCTLALAIGALVGVLGTIHHGFAFSVVSLIMVASLLTGLRLLFRVRTVALFAGLGVFLVVGALSQKSAGGSVLIQNNLVGSVWSYGVAIIALVVLAWPNLRPRARDTMGNVTDSQKVVDAS